MIVLDTHTWLWWLSAPNKLSNKAQANIDRNIDKATIHISSISSWEVAILVKKGRLKLTMDVADWVARSEALPFVRFVPVNSRIAIRSVELNKDLPPDPADRIIIATTLYLGATLVTKDHKLREYSGVTTLW